MTIEYAQPRIARYELSIDINAPRDRVWKSLTDEINAWWLPSFHMVGEGSVVTLSTEAGGALYEKMEGGGSLLWSTVQMVVPGETLHLVGHAAPDWGGPNTGTLRLGLEDTDTGCTLRVTHAVFGNIDDAHIGSMEEGWTQLFSEGLKAYVETGAIA